MAEPVRYVVVGNGLAGNKAAFSLRHCDPEGSITIVSADTLLYYRLASLPAVFVGQDYWREFLVHQPGEYVAERIDLRRQSEVVKVDSRNRRLVLADGEAVSYDKLLVASGGAPYLPQHLEDWRDQLSFIYSYEAAVRARRELPPDGSVVILGGDMFGIAMGRTLRDLGFRVSLVPYERPFWPHRVADDDLPAFLEGVEKLGIEVIRRHRPWVERIEPAGPSGRGRRLVFADGSTVEGDMLMPFFGTLPAVDFMHGSGVEIEHAVRVDRGMRTANEDIWAVGDACQLASGGDQPTAYMHFSRVDVVRMSEVAARNMTGGEARLQGLYEERLALSETGELESPYLGADA